MPNDRGPKPAATAAAEPPELPPVLRFVFQGFNVDPYLILCVVPLCPNSGVVVLPKIIAPCSKTFLTTGASLSLDIGRLSTNEPLLVK